MITAAIQAAGLGKLYRRGLRDALERFAKSPLEARFVPPREKLVTGVPVVVALHLL